jgi:hypothetical protein
MDMFIDEIIAEQAKNINSEMERILKERIKETFGYDIDLEAEIKRKFPRIIAIKHDDGSIHYWWNDGSVNGKEIIGFYYDDCASLKDNKCTISIHYK